MFYYAVYTCSCYATLFLKRCEQMSQIGIWWQTKVRKPPKGKLGELMSFIGVAHRNKGWKLPMQSELWLKDNCHHWTSPPHGSQLTKVITLEHTTQRTQSLGVFKKLESPLYEFPLFWVSSGQFSWPLLLLGRFAGLYIFLTSRLVSVSSRQHSLSGSVSHQPLLFLYAGKEGTKLMWSDSGTSWSIWVVYFLTLRGAPAGWSASSPRPF